MPNEQHKECPSCAFDVPQKAETCPYCGYEFPQLSQGVKYAAILMALLLAWPLFKLLMYLF